MPKNGCLCPKTAILPCLTLRPADPQAGRGGSTGQSDWSDVSKHRSL
jgi:hypothetical protein